jgi:hypothetical protein
MTKLEQIRFIKDLTNSISDRMIDKISQDKVPNSWDGFELRHWLNKIIEFENIWSDKIRKKPWRKRIKDCNNTMIVNNLY